MGRRFVKVDDLSSPYGAAEIEAYRKAIDRCGRPMVLSLSPGPTPIEQATHVAAHANMWRLLPDLWDDYGMVKTAFAAMDQWAKIAGPGHWPDPDMLPLGMLRKHGPPTGPANTLCRLTLDEQTTLMTLWCVARCPMMFGGNLPETPAETLALIENPEAIAANQDGRDPISIGKPNAPVWMSRGQRKGETYLAVFNLLDVVHIVNVELNDNGRTNCSVRDIWARQDLPDVDGVISCRIPPHGARFYRLGFKD